MLRFPKLHEKIIDVVTNLLRSRLVPTNSMVENIVSIELAYINTRHPDFYKEASSIGSMLKSPDMERDDSRQQQGRGRPNEGGRSRGGQQRPHSVHFPSQPGQINGVMEQVDSDKENSQPIVRGQTRSGSKDNVINASTWLSNILPAPREEAGAARDLSPSPLHRAVTQVVDIDHTTAMSPVKPVNLLPEIPVQSGRKLNDREQRDCEVIERLIKSYFYLVRKSIQDSIPKSIMHFMVNYVKDNLQSELVSTLYKAEQIENLLSESEHIGQRRKEAAEMLDALRKASQIISEIRETHVW